MCRATPLAVPSDRNGPIKVPQPAWIAEELPVSTRRGALPEPKVSLVCESLMSMCRTKPIPAPWLLETFCMSLSSRGMRAWTDYGTNASGGVNVGCQSLALY